MNLTNDPKYDKWNDQLQSPVTSYNLDKPMNLAAFEALPDHAKKEYLKTLKRNHGAGVQQIAQMLGIKRADACDLMAANGVSTKGKRAENADAAWAAFLGDYVFPEIPERERFTLSDHAAPDPDVAPSAAETSAPVEAPEEAAPVEPQEAAEAPKPEPVPVPPPAPETQEEPEPKPRPAAPRRPEVTTVLRAFGVDLTGPIDAVLRRLQNFSAMVGDRTVCVTISVEDEA